LKRRKRISEELKNLIIKIARKKKIYGLYRIEGALKYGIQGLPYYRICYQTQINIIMLKLSR